MKYNFADKIKDLRIKHNLTQEELANKLHISDKSISKWELGLSRPSLENLEIIAEVFDITLDELIRNKDKNNKKIIKKIVLTGGPCAGKTTAMNWIENFFSKQGYKVLFVPEAATLLITGGVNPYDAKSNINFQKSIIKTQMNLEDVFYESAYNYKEDKILIVCDRGLLDNKVYTSKRDMKFIFKEFNLTESKIMERYDAIFHLVSAAKGAKDYYNYDNPARTESIEDAIKLDDDLISAWTGHPHLRIIDNTTDFENKMKRLLTEISSILGEPFPYEIERKYLIEMPDLEYLNKLKNCSKVNIVQTYLKSNDNEEIRVRQRGINGSYTYSKTKKINISDIKRLEVEERLSSEEYIKELQNADPKRSPIIKERYCLCYKNQYFEIDIYPFMKDYALCEIELIDENKQVELPNFLNVIKEVTEDNNYKNSNIAKLIKDKKTNILK